RDRLFPRQGLGLLNGQAETLQFLYGASAEIRDGQAAALPPGYCLSYRLLPRFTPSIDPDNVVPVLPAPDLVSCVFTHQSVPPARWCLGRGTSVILARPSDLRADETPPVLVHPSFGVTDPLRRTGLEKNIDQQGVVLTAAVVVAIQDGSHNIPW